MTKSNFVAYPILLKPIFKEKVWGGRNLEILLHKNLPKEKRIGESWEVSDRPGDSCKIKNGTYKGKDLRFLFKYYKKELLGDIKFGRFPLLIKFIDSQDDLSVQVHPDETYAYKNENGEWGKTECWYVVEAKKDAKIIYGLKGIKNKNEFKKIIQENKLRRHLNYVPVRKGDFIFMPAGTVHALLKGIVVAEIQQSSDVTYRLYDWDRKNTDSSRPLHIKYAIDATNLKRKNPKIMNAKSKKSMKLIECKYFTVKKLFLNTEFILNKNTRFQIYTILSGCAKIQYQNSCGDGSRTAPTKSSSESIKNVIIKKGDNILIPVVLQKFRIIPNHNVEMLITTL